ncbi:MAG: hypothetical protein V4497_11800 [Bacteroidota bacterium]
MKNIKKIFAILTLLLLLLSCENDGGDSKLDFKYGAVVDIQKQNNTDTFIDLVSVQNGDDFNLGLTVDLAVGNISSMNLVGFYTKKNGTITKATLVSNIVTLPATFNLKRKNIFDAFANINNPGDFESGDKLTISADITLKDGTLIKLINDDGSNNFSSNIATSNLYKLFQTYNVACTSDLAGTYSVISSGTSTDSGPTPSENPISNFHYTVKITALGGGEYTMSDAFAGLYILWYDIYGVNFEVEGSFSDVCGTISGKFPEPFDTDVIISGKVNPNGTLSIHWQNGFNDFGDAIYTKQ